MESIGERIRKRRLELNLTQKDIYNQCGISNGNLSDWENGKYNPSTTNLIKLCKVLKCSEAYITGRDTQNENSTSGSSYDSQKVNATFKEHLTDDSSSVTGPDMPLYAESEDINFNKNAFIKRMSNYYSKFLLLSDSDQEEIMALIDHKLNNSSKTL